MPYQIPVGSDLFTVILVYVTLLTMQDSDVSEFSGMNFLFYAKIQNNLHILVLGIICYSQSPLSSGFSENR